jgi:twitching motility two-component system response regulator PilG
MKGPDDPHRSPIATDHKQTVDTDASTVLLVDDSSTIRHSARRILEAQCYTVIMARDGFDALSKVVAFRPAIVLVDIMAPRLDGYQTCALIKNNADFRTIPVILLSSKDGLFDKARARVVGSDAHLYKPFSEQSLIAAVRQHAIDVVHQTSGIQPKSPNVSHDNFAPVV